MKFQLFKCNLFLIVVLPLFIFKVAIAQKTTRPLIWVKPSDKEVILNDIKQNKWKKDYYEAFTKRVQADLVKFQKDPSDYLMVLPFDLTKQRNNQIPPFKTVLNKDKDAAERRNKLELYLKNAVDCGVLYYLTDDEKYAEYSSAVFYTFMKSLLQIEPSQIKSNGGWIYQDDHLRESREIGAQIPIIYDFIYPYLIKGGKAYNFATNAKESINISETEQVFKTYINLALNHGMLNSNWPVLESSSLVGNTLALDSETERNENLQFYLEKNTANQDALPKVAKVFRESGNWPESLNYSNAVTELTTYLMTLLTKVNPSLNLGNKYPEVPMAMTVPYNLTYPNNKELISFGDGNRNFGKDYNSYEIAYLLGKLSNSEEITSKFGSLINTGIFKNEYDRAKLKPRSYEPHPYFDEPLRLLWFSPTIKGETKDYPKPVTNNLPFAGIVVQRNHSTTNKPEDGLMTFVGGAAFIHGHASGMNMELYGKGYALGVKAGKGEYTTEEHENYYRLFAGHNTVIVNGSSRGEGKWSNNAINKVVTEAVEPQFSAAPVSKNNSFSATSFLDDKGDQAEAKQLRTMAIVRTSPTTGYYVDVYKSKSSLPHEFHDYIYHNIGDQLSFIGTSKDFKLKSDENRYMANSNLEWSNNESFKYPGWHYFKDVQTSEVNNQNVEALFNAKSLSNEGVNMKLFITGAQNREYTKVMAPITKYAPGIYAKKPTPTLVIRKTGEAWDAPFAVIYEPFTGNKVVGSAKSVNAINSNNVFKGFIVESTIETEKIKQFIIVQDNDTDIFEDTKLGIKFTGRYAVITCDDKGEISSIYIGSGSSLNYQSWKLQSVNQKPIALNLSVLNQEVTVNTDSDVDVVNPKKYKVKIEKVN